MIYIQFLIKNNKGKIDDLLGSDGVFKLDGRYTLQRHIVTAHERKEQLKNIHPNICGYKIFKGERFADNNYLITGGIFENDY